MELFIITHISSTPERNFLSVFWNGDKSAHYTLEGATENYEGDGDYTDGNGILWSVASQSPIKTKKIVTEVVMTTIKPIKEFNVSQTFTKS